uniref:Uncharacterized protein n=1 Tax=Anguilla anguilla TaxID=7936 RepID=A0A0E9QS13_ANGAN
MHAAGTMCFLRLITYESLTC